MVKKSFSLFLLTVFLLFVIGGFGFVAAEWVDCWNYNSQAGGTKTTCNAVGCLWASDDLTEVVGVDIDLYDYWCDDLDHCCFPNECWQYAATNETYCEDENPGNLNCTWDPFATAMAPNGGTLGGCMMDWSSGGDWGGVEEGCWQNDANQEGCTTGDNSQSCEWKANSANQNPWCWIKNLNDAQDKNPLAANIDIGCCEMKGCWTYDGNQTKCENNTAFSNLCTWVTKAEDPYCPDSVGCCYTKWCGEVGDNETLCDSLNQDLMMPCIFNNVTSQCEEMGGGGFDFYDDDADSCMQNGGWYDMNGDCVMPGDSDGGGGFMFGGEAHCWFADNQVGVCGNLTGCAYCVAGSGANGVDNCTDEDGNGYSDNICCGKNIGWCEGHNIWDLSRNYTNTDDTVNLNCTHIQIKSACKYGPLPTCKWTNSSVNVGSYCSVGKSTEAKDVPPVPFCEHPDAKNNETLCNQLVTEYMMPCEWNDTYHLINGVMQVNCSFNPNAVFGSEDTDSEYEVINSEYSCVAAGGTWMTEYWIDNSTGNEILKSDSWCEKGALYDPATGMAAGNKGNCDTDCWACEFRYNGSTWENSTTAEGACLNSVLDYCQWKNDSNAPNAQGYCDYPNEMNYGAGDCNVNCKDCGLKSNPSPACTGSQANCKWVNDTSSNGTSLVTGICVDKSKKTCSDDCFSCYDDASCFASLLDCTWEATNNVCKPNNFDGEVCFDAIDNDNDGFTDCGDPDCSFDNACGGNNFADCGSVIDPTLCNATLAFGSLNCSWYNFTWEPEGHCGMPGENCWEYDGDPATCGSVAGCTNESVFGGSDGFCDINTSIMDNAQCWDYNDNETYCSAQADCGWVTDSWCSKPEAVGDEWCASQGGWCDSQLFAGCMNLDGNSTACDLNTNCTWHSEDWMDAGEGFCDPVCFNWELNSTACIAGDLSGICEWRDAGDMCMSSTFDMMAGSSGGKSGCWQYDGNMTACASKNVTCVWENDTNVGNAVSENVAGQNISGWCNDKAGYELVGDMEGALILLGMDEEDADVVDYLDIDGFGMRVTDNAYGFGMGMGNITDSVICNGYQISTMVQGTLETQTAGTGQNYSRFRWYLDTDGSSGVQQHCSATDSNEDSLSYPDYEFYIDYTIQNDTATNNIKTTKKLYKCTLNDSSTDTWKYVPTNVFITDDKKFTCYKSGFGAVFVFVEKEALEGFSLFNVTAPLKIMAVSFDGPGSGDGVDDVGPAYYTPGTVDFGFVDCSDPNTKDSKCKNFQKFGSQIYEDCKNSVDDDGDNNVDCDDTDCVFMPACAAGTAFDWDSLCATDYKAPVVVFTKIDRMADSAIIKYDTDEPANGSVMWYNTSLTCATQNGSVDDVGSTTISYDDYKPFHRAVLDSTNLGYDLVNNTAHYYKMKVCDACGNCGTSSCLNFTTKKQNKPFIFRINLPDGYNAELVSSEGDVLYSGNFTYTTSSGTKYDIGIKTNTSVSRNMNLTITYSDLSMKFIGVDIYKPKVLNLENAFIIDTSSEVMGIDSSTKAWNFILNDLNMGGPGDAIELYFPIAYSSSNTIKWMDDDQAGETDVSSYVTCRAGTGIQTICTIPTSMGL